MQNIFILHSLNGDTLEYWGQDLKHNFESEYSVFMPKFPIRAESSYEKFDIILSKFLESNELNENSVVICHSIGNPYFIRFCREHNFTPNNYIAVAPGAVYNYPSTRNDYIVAVKNQAYLKQDDFDFANKFKDIYLFYSDEDDGNLEKFTRFAKDFNAKEIYLKNYSHFDGRHEIHKVPELIELIKKLLKNEE